MCIKVEFLKSTIRVMRQREQAPSRLEINLNHSTVKGKMKLLKNGFGDVM